MKRTFYYDWETEHWQEGIYQSLMVDAQIEQLSKEGKDRFFVPRQWTVQSRAGGIVEISLDIVLVSFSEGEINSIKEKEWLIEFDFSQSKIQAWPVAFLAEREKGWVKSFHCPNNIVLPDMVGASCIEIPAIVTEAALSFMQEHAMREFGFRPTYMGRVPGLKHIIAFCHRPLDLNIHLLRSVIGEPYERLFPREQNDNYRPLCRFFQIARPPKSLRRFYGEFPENILAYVLLRQLGFRDINIIRRFFQRDVLFGYRLSRLSYYSVTGLLTDDFRQYANPYLEWMGRFCHWYLQHRNEVHLANCLHHGK